MKGKAGPKPETVKEIEERENEPELVMDADDTSDPLPSVEESDQPELFSEPGLIHRALEVALTEEELAELHEELGKVCSDSLEKEELLEITKDQIKSLKTSMQEIRAKIRRPTRIHDVECRWEIFIEENMKKLIRIDTDETVMTSPLTAEDRAKELDQAEAANEPKEEEVPA